MSLEKIQQLVGSVNKSLDDNEKLAIPIIAAKLAKYIEIYPQDQTLGTMSRVFEKMALDNHTLFIRKAEFKSLYNKLYTNNTKVAEIFRDELGIIDNSLELKTYNRDDAVQKIDNYQFGDAILANALSSVFDGSPLKMYSKYLADNALKSIANTLNVWHLKPASLTIEQGNEKFLVVKADYETPKGLTSFYIPIEIQNNKIVEASILIGNLGMYDFNNNNIKSYISKQAGNKLQINASTIIDVLVSASSQNREISDTEIALTKLNASRQDKSEFFQNQIVGQKIAEAEIKDVVLPKYGEFESFEKSFTSPYGIASFQFGEDKVKIAREHISRELFALGYKNSQVVVTGHDSNTIFYGVSLDAGRVGFTVPVKLADNKLSKPSIILCNGTASSFDKEGINQLYINNQSDFKVAASASPLYNLKPSELINNIKQALDVGNHEQAEDALNVLSNAGNHEAYAIGFKAFLDGLSEKKASPPHICNMIVKNSTSQYGICGHTGLPIHKTYIDNEGNCRPLYRRNISEDYEAATFMNHKIFG